MNKAKKEKRHNTLRILGNGDSLREILTGFSTQIVDYLVVNRFVLSEYYTILKPKYYVLADCHFFSRPEGINILKKIADSTTWDMFLFVPNKEYDKISSIINDKNLFISLLPFNNCNYQGYDNFKLFFWKKNLAMPLTQNVLVSSIHIAISLEYSIVELYGVEHSWTKYLFVNERNEVCLWNPHFYDEKKPEIKTVNEIQNCNYYKVHLILRDYANMFASYWELKKYATYKNIRIINCTKGSFIDAFERHNNG
jgi:hypothetical protein